MGRYSTLYRLPGNLYLTGSPVIISAGALLRDDQLGRVLVQVKFTNLAAQEIKAVKVSIDCFDVSGDALDGINEYQYLDLAAVRGDSFGDRRAIPLPNDVTRSFSVNVKSVLFADGSSWQNEADEDWIPLPKHISLESALGSTELAGQYARETSDKSQYEPYEIEDIWHCACGAINKESESYCVSCGVEKDIIFDSMDEELLEKKFRKWISQRDMNDYSEQEHTTKKKSTVLKVLLTVIPIVLVLAAIAFAMTQFALPFIAYRRADEKLALQDYAGAIEGFTALGDYKDAPDKVMTARYGAAVDMMNDGDLEKARVEFILLGNYRDCPDRIQRCDYLAAEKLLAAKNYDAAREAFLNLGNYSDAPDRANEALYSKAQALLKDGKNDEAIAIFEQLGNYSDSASQIETIRQSEVEQVQRLIRQNKMDEAWEAYGKLKDYHPEPLTAADFVTADGNIIEYLDESAEGLETFGVYRYDALGYDSREDVVETARGIHLGDSRLAVLMAYGEPDESGKLILDGGFYTELVDEEVMAAMEEECDHYIRYSFNNYKMYFYFDKDDNLTWLFFSNADFTCSTPDPVDADEEDEDDEDETAQA